MPWAISVLRLTIRREISLSPAIRAQAAQDSAFLTQYLYNERNLLTQVTDPLGFLTYYYNYDAGGNLTAVRDARSSSSTDNTYKTGYTYTNTNKIASVTDSLAHTTNYTYDVADNETTITQANGNIVSKSYDNANRLNALLYNNSLMYSFTYDTTAGASAGNVTRVDQGPAGTSTVNWQYTYDKGNRPVSAREYLGQSQNFGYATTYDKVGNTTTLTVDNNGTNPSQTYNYTYNANNWLASASDTFGVTNLYYDDKGNKDGTEYPSASAKTYRNFDNNNRPTTISNYSGANLLNEYAYGYDKAGNITTESVGGQSTLYTYDSLNRLNTWFSPGTSKYTKYNYDNAGNIRSTQWSTDTVNWNNDKSFTYDAAGQLTNTGFSFDASGNQTSDTANNYTYDAENRLTEVRKASDNSVVSDYGYDYKGRRISKTVGGSTTYYHYDPNSDNVVAETDSSNNVIARYAYLPGDYKPYSMTKYTGSTPTTYYYLANSRGDVTAMVSQSGSVVAKYTYDPWGKALTITDGGGNDVSNQPTHIANLNPYRYAGYRYDTETNLYYLLARYYDPNTYRFLTRDPDGGDKDKPLTQNLYAYAGDNPVNNVDPDGNYWEAVAAGVGAVGGGVILSPEVLVIGGAIIIGAGLGYLAHLGWQALKHRYLSIE